MSLFPAREPLAVCAANAHDEKLRMQCASGGVFSVLAQDFIRKGGVVFGAAFDRRDWSVHHIAATNEEELEAVRGSKYVQSETGDAYRMVAKLLREGRRVLFSGTPCQIAGLRAFLTVSGSLNDEARGRLLLVSLICLSVPSPRAWREFLKEIPGNVNDVKFRDKTNGWKAYALKVESDSPSVTSETGRIYMRGFLNGLFSRRSCHDCKFRSLRDGADLMIGDYWDVATRFPAIDDDKGTSLVLVNTPTGAEAFEAVKSEFAVESSDFAHAVEVNPALVKSAPSTAMWCKFFGSLPKRGFTSAVEHILRPPFKARAKVALVAFLRKLCLI